MTLDAAFRALREQHGWRADPEQDRLIEICKTFFEAFSTRKKGWLSKPKTMQGLYVYGSVGAGKSKILNTMIDQMNPHRVHRKHFHALMQDIHHQLAMLEGEKDPLKAVARHYGKKTELLFLDEFQVSDIGDAMILGKLLEYLEEESIVVVASSNTAPKDLYHGGIQRERFLPAIEWIETHLQVVPVFPALDFRSLIPQPKGRYWVKAYSPSMLPELCAQLWPQGLEHVEMNGSLHWGGRSFPFLARGEGILVLQASVIFEAPWSVNDYLNIPLIAQHVIVLGLEAFSSDRADRLKRWIHWMDVMYEHGIKLWVQSSCPIESLASGKKTEGFDRAYSRLKALCGYQPKS